MSEQTDKPWFVYVLRCTDGSLYTGVSTDPLRRFEEHRQGKGARYTRVRPPEALVYAERAADRGAALSREAAIKKLRRPDKLMLIHAAPFLAGTPALLDWPDCARFVRLIV
jgi:predicted GIY-YIG superfamily endonuclease